VADKARAIIWSYTEGRNNFVTSPIHQQPEFDTTSR
jgi:hypothetical protein